MTRRAQGNQILQVIRLLTGRELAEGLDVMDRQPFPQRVFIDAAVLAGELIAFAGLLSLLWPIRPTSLAERTTTPAGMLLGVVAIVGSQRASDFRPLFWETRAIVGVALRFALVQDARARYGTCAAQWGCARLDRVRLPTDLARLGDLLALTSFGAMSSRSSARRDDMEAGSAGFTGAFDLPYTRRSSADTPAVFPPGPHLPGCGSEGDSTLLTRQVHSGNDSKIPMFTGKTQ